MRSPALKTLTLAGGALAATAAPASAASPLHPGLTTDEAGLAPLVHIAKTPLVTRDVALARKVARVEGQRLDTDYQRTARSWSLTKLKRHHRHLTRELRAARRDRAHARAEASSASSASPRLEAIAACESGGDPATDTGNGFYGKYQFTLATWQAVGGSGNPAQASEAEQDRRAAMLMARAGPGQWPVCGR
ncbi:MAG TPA: transglycosylase family protein [Baekduia sp.]|uniref:transglycosylase family protein n=1 Tax=Baekduia sp. TaxID=2600305 RepID=UPI002D76C718|nr:transglycosylase family protein [Baekduia sp.]HET6508472.1 transglycosylase family protein [Baekduia sp.]